MGTLKLVGGIITAATAGLILIMAIRALINGIYTGYLHYLLAPMIVTIVVLIGGILAIMGKTIGGVIALIVGVIWLMTAIFLNVEVYPTEDWVLFLMHHADLSFFYVDLDFAVWGYLYVETLMVLAGGILGTVGRSD